MMSRYVILEVHKKSFVSEITSTRFLIVISLVLAAFTHLWNVSQFPGINLDEGIYINRALLVLSGLGPQEIGTSWDHPFMGQIVLASLFKLIGYPNSLSPSPTVDSIETLYAVPRIFMGILFLIDTFLVFMIGRYSYNKNVAFVASVLFAVMPMSWQLRRVVLDSIELPFVLSSILLVLLVKEKLAHYSRKKITIMIFLSGVFLGLAIFTKVPALTIIPLLLYLIIRYSKLKIMYAKDEQKEKKYILTILAIWFIPVILIPLIWPLYAISLGQFDRWEGGVLLQATGRSTTLYRIWDSFLKIDPLLLFLTIGGLIFSLFRKDIFPILWIVPFLLLVIAIGWFLAFHWNFLFPAFCICVAVLLVELPYRLMPMKLRRYTHVSIIGVITIFGFITTVILISLNVASTQYQAAATTIQYLKSQMTRQENKTINEFSIISSPIFHWLFKYPLGINNTISYDQVEDIKTPNVLLVIDPPFRILNNNQYEKVLSSGATYMLNDSNLNSRIVGGDIDSWIKVDLGAEKRICGVDIWWYIGNSTQYNFTVSTSNDDRSQKIIPTYQINGKTIAEEYKASNLIGRYADIYFKGNSANNIGGISEIVFYGDENMSNPRSQCSKLLPKNITISNNSHIEPPDLKMKQTVEFLSQSSVISKINPSKKYDTHVYPFTGLQYADVHHIQLMTNALTGPYSIVQAKGNNTAMMVWSEAPHNDGPTFVNVTSLLPLYWKNYESRCSTSYRCTINYTTGWNNNSSLQISTTNNTRNTWSGIYGKEIEVKPEERYQLLTHMKLNKFAIGSHVALQGYNETSKSWYPLTTQCPPGTNGPLEWREFSCIITVPNNIIKMRTVLNAGWSSQQNKQAITWFDSLYTVKVDFLYVTDLEYSNETSKS
jgi:hypothetical protein